MTDFKSFKHRNMQLITYGDDPAEPGPTNKTHQLVSDWNRWATSKDKCFIYIQGQPLSELVDSFIPEQVSPNESSEERGIRYDAGAQNLRNFFREHVFEAVEDVAECDILVEMAMHHFHQGGLLLATNNSINAQNHSRHQLKDPERRVNLGWTKNGLEITEENTYKAWSEIDDKGKPINHTCSDNKPYYAQTKSTYLLKPDGRVQLLDLEVDCPSKNLASIFDKREPNEQPHRGLRNTINFLMTSMNLHRETMDAKAPEARDLYQDETKPEGPKV